MCNSHSSDDADPVSSGDRVKGVLLLGTLALKYAPVIGTSLGHRRTRSRDLGSRRLAVPEWNSMVTKARDQSET